MAFLLKNLSVSMLPQMQSLGPWWHTHIPPGGAASATRPGEGKETAQFSSAFCPRRPERWLTLERLQLSAAAQKQHIDISAFTFSGISSPLTQRWHFLSNSVLSGNMKLVIFKHFYPTQILISVYRYIYTYTHIYVSPNKCLIDKTKISPTTYL